MSSRVLNICQIIKFEKIWGKFAAKYMVSKRVLVISKIMHTQQSKLQYIARLNVLKIITFIFTYIFTLSF